MEFKFQGKKIAIMATDRCNGHCRHCHLDYTGHFDSARLHDLSVELSKKYIVKLNGAEIILHPEYFDILPRIGQRFVKTNGIEIVRNPNILEELKKVGVHSITLSHHFDSHNLLSSIPLEIVEAAAKRVVDAGMDLWFMTVITADNYKSLPMMCEKAQLKGASTIYFVNLLKTGRATKMDDKSLNDAQISDFLELLQTVRSQYKKTDLNIARSGTFESVKSIKNSFICPAGYNSIAITPDEKVKPCIGMSGPEYEIGYVRNNDIIITKPLYHDSRHCLVHQVCNRSYAFENYLKP